MQSTTRLLRCSHLPVRLPAGRLCCCACSSGIENQARVAGGCSALTSICLSCCACAGDIEIGVQNSKIEYGAQLVEFIRIRLAGVADNFDKKPQPVRRSTRLLHGHSAVTRAWGAFSAECLLALHGWPAASLPRRACSKTMSCPRRAHCWRASRPAPETGCVWGSTHRMLIQAPSSACTWAASWALWCQPWFC